LDKLEWVWGLDYFTLNVDTRFNLVHLNAALHAAFDSKKGWLLLPVDVDILMTSSMRLPLHRPNLLSMRYDNLYLFFHKKAFRYKFIPLPPMEGTAVEFYNGDYTTEPTSSNSSLHFYPFNQLPIVESHVYPHYVIYNLGEKL
ncbi:hypothetical protein JOM56_007136, partial [Amanita muscaria]